MSIDNKSIKWLHVEPTSRCNAWCPSCPRNMHGYKLEPDLKIQDLSTEILHNTINRFPNLSTVQLCGNLGDPCASKIIDDQLDTILSFKNIFRIQIHTNGSLRTKTWWENLAKKIQHLEQAEVYFAIDGLSDTHHIYRQGTDFNKIIENATAFINAGGTAYWQFIPFKHNQHQILNCLKLSKSLGFKNFIFVRNARYTSDAYHYRTGNLIDIQPWDDPKKDKNVFFRENNTVEKENCMHLSIPSVYLGSNGLLTTCCYLKTIPLDSGIDINSELENNQIRSTCLKNCGNNND